MRLTAREVASKAPETLGGGAGGEDAGALLVVGTVVISSQVTGRVVGRGVEEDAVSAERRGTCADAEGGVHRRRPASRVSRSSRATSKERSGGWGSRGEGGSQGPDVLGGGGGGGGGRRRGTKAPADATVGNRGAGANTTRRRGTSRRGRCHAAPSVVRDAGSSAALDVFRAGVSARARGVTSSRRRG